MVPFLLVILILVVAGFPLLQALGWVLVIAGLLLAAMVAAFVWASR